MSVYILQSYSNLLAVRYNILERAKQWLFELMKLSIDKLNLTLE